MILRLPRVLRILTYYDSVTCASSQSTKIAKWSIHDFRLSSYKLSCAMAEQIDYHARRDVLYFVSFPISVNL